MKNFRKALKTKRLYFDGAFGTVLQSMQSDNLEPPEIYNIKMPELVSKIHKAYIEAGSNIITTNTFGVNSIKYSNYEEMIFSAIDCANSAVSGREDVFVAFDIGPTGRILEPFGDLSFEEAVSIFSKNVKSAVKKGVDLIIIETMNDSYETKAAILAAKENSNLPILVTNAYDKSGKLMTGADPITMIAMLEGLEVDGIGINCSFGPDSMMNIIDTFVKYSSLPVIVNPNAGLPIIKNSKTYYSFSDEEFSDLMKIIAEKGVSVLGGCCGTTPSYIKKTIEKTKNIPFVYPEYKNNTIVTSYTHSVIIDKEPIIIGERINPTGKSKIKDALRNENYSYILNEAVNQTQKGAHILDVNAGLPEIDEASVLKKLVMQIQAISDTPLQIDSSDVNALENSLRIYNGKAIINSVNGKLSSMSSVFPLAKKYGAVVIGLTLDENGIPESAIERVSIAKKIISTAKEYGINEKNIIIDPLCLTVSSGDNNAQITLDSIKLLTELGIKTILGVSNVSFGLPMREKINSTFYLSALENGLNCAIVNPFSDLMMDAYYIFKLIHGLDKSCLGYINYSKSNDSSKNTITIKHDEVTLKKSIINGIKEDSIRIIKQLLNDIKPLEIINNHIIPALAEVGESFDNKTIFLPQLLMSAEAATAAFNVLKDYIPKEEINNNRKVILATVKGDVHDIGKNIVKVILESYGFLVFDLGKDVSPNEIFDAVVKHNCKLVGLSALMTTTVPAMEETIKLLHDKFDDVKVMVGGAVLSKEYSEMIKADYYATDAMDAVKIAEKFYK